MSAILESKVSLKPSVFADIKAWSTGEFTVWESDTCILNSVFSKWIPPSVKSSSPNN